MNPNPGHSTGRERQGKSEKLSQIAGDQRDIRTKCKEWDPETEKKGFGRKTGKI